MLNCVSVWQPWSSLLVHGWKLNETRSWPAPRYLIGKRIGIAATKTVKREQLQAYGDPDFQEIYAMTGLEELEDLPRGCILGTALLASCEIMTEEHLQALTEMERTFGYWTVGRYAWRLEDPKPYKQPIAARGSQGIWQFHDRQTRDHQAGPAEARRHL